MLNDAMEEQNTDYQEQTALKIIQDINSGLVDPQLLDKSTRHRCVEVLIGEGYTHSHMAQILKRSEKTISRDIANIRQKNSLTPSMEFAKETVGELVARARTHSSYLMRLARDKSSPPASKAEAEFLAWRVTKELVEKLQTLGYMPLKPQQISGDICHYTFNQKEDSYEDVKKMILEIESVAKETKAHTPELADEISHLNVRIDKAEAILKVKDILQKQKNGQINKEDQNE